MNDKVSTLARVVNGWQMNTDTMGIHKHPSFEVPAQPVDATQASLLGFRTPKSYVAARIAFGGKPENIRIVFPRGYFRSG